jgi:hypothetical protein
MGERCEECNCELVFVGVRHGEYDMGEPVEEYDCPLCRANERAEKAERERDEARVQRDAANQAREYLGKGHDVLEAALAQARAEIERLMAYVAHEASGASLPSDPIDAVIEICEGRKRQHEHTQAEIERLRV